MKLKYIGPHLYLHPLNTTHTYINNRHSGIKFKKHIRFSGDIPEKIEPIPETNLCMK